MGRAFTPGLRADACCLVRKIRELPIPGTIKVSVGHVVESNQVIAHALLQGEMRIVRVAEALGISARDVATSLKISLGDTVSIGQTIAEVSSLFGLIRNSAVSPIDGVIELVSDTTGHLGVRAKAKMLELRAHIAGVVTRIVEGRSVEIEGRGAFIQGIFGVGGEHIGSLRVLAPTASRVIRESDVPQECSGQVLVTERRASIESLRAAAARGAVGFVTGSIDDQTLREYVGYDIGVAVTGDEDLSMSVIVTEGFGDLKMSERIVELLAPLNGKSCSINGTTQVRAGAIRPEIFVASVEPHARVEVENGDGSLEVGTRIRCIRVPFFGRLGVVTDLPTDLRQIETGAWARVLCAKLDGEDQNVFVPRANVERV